MVLWLPREHEGLGQGSTDPSAAVVRYAESDQRAPWAISWLIPHRASRNREWPSILTGLPSIKSIRSTCGKLNPKTACNEGPL